MKWFFDFREGAHVSWITVMLCGVLDVFKEVVMLNVDLAKEVGFWMKKSLKVFHRIREFERY